MHEYKHHELSKFFPMLPPEEFEQLKASISEHGLREPIVLLDGKILDGRNRYKACLEAGVEPRFEEYARGNSEALDFVVDMNMRRRHLDEGQKAQIIIDVDGRPEADKGAKQAQTVSPRRKGPASFTDLAKRSGVSVDTVKRVAEVQDDPEITAKLRQGYTVDGEGRRKRYSARAAVRERMQKTADKAKVEPTDKGMYARAPGTKIMVEKLQEIIGAARRWSTDAALQKIDPEGHTPLLIKRIDEAVAELQTFRAKLEDLRNG